MQKELWLTILIFLILIAKVAGKNIRNENIVATVSGLLLAILVGTSINNAGGSLFNDFFITNSLIAFEKNILLLGTLLISMFSYNWLKNHKNVEEFYILLLSTLLGMFLMISSGHLLMFYLGLELSTIPLAAIANFDLDKRASSEAAFKLIISSAFSSALLLLGISFVYGTTGTLSFVELPKLLDHRSSLQIFAFILLFAGFAFKISVVPFHLWTADVYEGSPVAVTAYLSVISKGAVLFVFVSVLYNVFQPLTTVWYNMLMVLSLATIIVGNLFAIRQNNLKRFLAFSSVTQIGYVLIGVSGEFPASTASVVYFILIYIFSNLAAFAVISIISSVSGKETISDYKALYKTNPLLSWVLTIALFSLAGVPPTAGFFGKYFLLLAGTHKAASSGYLFWIVIAALNLVVSFYYYLKVVKAIFMDTNEQPIQKVHIPVIPKIAMFICIAGIVLVGLLSAVYNYIYLLSTGAI
jgi:proton-translocating NADH-quinone oxidoreductase, chain N